MQNSISRGCISLATMNPDEYLRMRNHGVVRQASSREHHPSRIVEITCARGMYIYIYIHTVNRFVTDRHRARTQQVRTHNPRRFRRLHSLVALHGGEGVRRRGGRGVAVRMAQGIPLSLSLFLSISASTNSNFGGGARASMAERV